jgi:hypothetical protein
MSLTWKDAVATVLVGSVAAITFAQVKGYDWPIMGNWRVASLAALVIGLGACIVVESGATPTKNAWTSTATVLGSSSVILALAGIIFGSKVAFYVLVADIVALWLVASTHHVITAGP